MFKALDISAYIDKLITSFSRIKKKISISVLLSLVWTFKKKQNRKTLQMLHTRNSDVADRNK